MPDGSPAPDWVLLNDYDAVDDLAVGETREVLVTFSPHSNTAETVHHFILKVSGDNLPETDINLFVSVSQDGIGHVLFKVADLYTGTIDPVSGDPIEGLADARVRIQNEKVLSIEQTRTTDDNGEATFSDLPAGLYKCQVTATDHQQYTGRFWIKNGITTTKEIFLDYDLITVEWQVVETTIQDQYTVELEATYKTEVPAAVVTIEPASVSLPDMKTGDVLNGQFVLTNRGLIRADEVEFTPPGNDGVVKFEIFAEIPDTMEAHQSLTIPYRITCIRDLNPDNGTGGSLYGGYSSCGRIAASSICHRGRSRSRSPFCLNSPSGGVGGGGGGGGGSGSSSDSEMKGEYCPPADPNPCPNDDNYICCMQQNSEPGYSFVNLRTGEYTDQVMDMYLKVPGHRLEIVRSYYDNSWHFNHIDDRLEFHLEVDIGRAKYIVKDGVQYYQVDNNPALFVYKKRKFIEKDEDGWRWTDRSGNWKQYDLSGKALEYGNRYDQKVSYIYDSLETDRLTGIVDTYGNQVVWYEYDTDNQIFQIRDHAGRSVSYEYQNGKMVNFTNLVGGQWTYEYNAKGLLISKTDPIGKRIDISYSTPTDEVALVKEIRDNAGAAKFFDYSYDSVKEEFYAKVEYGNGKVKEQFYNADGKPTQTSINGEISFESSYDKDKNIETDSGGLETRYEYDQWDNIIRIEYPDGSVVSYEYDSESGNLLSKTNELGIVTAYEYDENDNLVRLTEAIGTDVERITEYTYDDFGNLTEKRQLGDDITAEAVTIMTYDVTSNIETETDPEGNVTRYLKYDVMGNILHKQDARGKLWEYSYDDMGHLKTAQDPLNPPTQYSYDEAGKKLSEIDANGHETRYEYDTAGNLISIIDAEEGVTRMTYGFQRTLAQPDGRRGQNHHAE